MAKSNGISYKSLISYPIAAHDGVADDAGVPPLEAIAQLRPFRGRWCIIFNRFDLNKVSPGFREETDQSEPRLFKRSDLIFLFFFQDLFEAAAPDCQLGSLIRLTTRRRDVHTFHKCLSTSTSHSGN